MPNRLTSCPSRPSAVAVLVLTTESLRDGCARSCNRAYQQAYQVANWERLGEKRRAKVQRNREAVRGYLLLHPCVDCGEADPIVLEFDHLGDKVASVSKMVQQASSLDRIFKEIAKCEVRCANCHKRKTARQFGWKVLDF